MRIVQSESCASRILILLALLLAKSEVSCRSVWNVSVPKSPPFIQELKDNGSSLSYTGPLLELFNTSLSSPDDDVFILQPRADWYIDQPAFADYNLTWLESGSLACVKEMIQQPDTNSSSSSAPEICLFSSSLAAYHALDELVKSTPAGHRPVLTNSWVRLAPVLLTLCTENTCPRKRDPKVWSAIYFLRVFHSSVWSLILLFTITTAALLYLFERTHPFRLGPKLQSDDDPDRINLQDCFIFAIFALFLRGFRKSPKSWAGMVLAVFWFAFCIICLVAYANGTVGLLLQPADQLELELETVQLAKSNRTIICEPNHRWCHLLHDHLGVTIQHLNRTLLTGLDWLSDVKEASAPLLVDHLTAQFLLSQGYYVASLYENDTEADRWVRTSLECPVIPEELHLPEMVLSFVAKTSEAAWSINNLFLRLEQTGHLNRIARRRSQPQALISNVCYTPPVDTGGLPIGLLKMNGPMLFIIVGSLLAIFMHGTQFVYLSFFSRSDSANVSSVPPGENTAVTESAPNPRVKRSFESYL